MILDPYLVRVIEQCTAQRLLEALRILYPEFLFTDKDTGPDLEKWLRKGVVRPGLALSTGRRNSFNGSVTCALLQALEVDRPKRERNRLDLAWAILDSAEGMRIIGHDEDLDAAREERLALLGQSGIS